MKQYTKKFLGRPVKGGTCKRSRNAKKAFEVIGITEKLYVDISTEFFNSALLDSMLERTDVVTITVLLESAFAAGLAVGFAENNEKIK